MSGRGHLSENFGMVGGVLADREEQRPGALVRERLEHGGCIGRPWTVVEGQHHFLVGEKVELLEMLKAKARAAGGVDLDHPADAERVGIGASGFRLRRSGGVLRNGRRHLDVVAGRKLLGGSGYRGRGEDGSRRRDIDARGSGEEPYGSNDTRRHDTRQHQTERITHRY
jgi:hypothetical protein